MCAAGPKIRSTQQAHQVWDAPIWVRCRGRDCPAKGLLMTLGFSIFLLAVGAILAFAVHATVAGIDIHVVGWILMGAGLLGLVLALAVFAPRRRRAVVTTSDIAYRAVAPGPTAQPTVTERATIDES